ncbi:YiaA/YiaB family inner membrane protein [Nodosilinea sp. PGN35]|uniref:YiaA/YiaB family inner membrane protein n=1 Tax=Nodosilinea sp. PGN35 TaxID=3020489 RepID=UPI0023B225A0|nr:YiaA/YiaB family inner membrane protein [Nodosilinea sp. TSF1-S3]MDF0366033.1 YiaA/YiaB family inner membrane protein [Nodosilinea sp. TSF1-S3]
MSSIQPPSSHSPAWIAQTWLAFGLSVGSLALGIFCLPVDAWVKGYMGMGTMFALGSTASLSKTVRDLHEAKQVTARIDEAKVEKLLADHHPLR